MKIVRVVYLSPSDRELVPAYISGLERVAQTFQTWLAEQTDGPTIRLHEPEIVEWYSLPHASSFYQCPPKESLKQKQKRAELRTRSESRNGALNDELRQLCDQGRFWEMVLEDAFALTGACFDDPENRWVFNIDAEPLCGQVIGGTSGVGLNGSNDLRGPIGLPLLLDCPCEPTQNPGFGRWVGGFGHELGHALGLPHPEGSPGGSHDGSLMYLGYLTFPETYLQPYELAILKASGFLSE